MTEPVAASDLQQPGAGPAAPPAGTSAAPATQKITIHFGQGVPVPEDMKANAVPSAEPMREMVIDTFRSMGVDEAVLQQARARTPITLHEMNLAQHKKTSLMQDRAWVAKYLDGDIEARRTMATLSIILGSSIKKDDAA